ncbi:MAG: carboxypeptidase-like regulatory domain-containing protein [bacterium]|nr:carboxypeptidase-like regulatory domain-containing protein [bacterium]
MKQLIIVLAVVVAGVFIWWQGATVDLMPGLGQEPARAAGADTGDEPPDDGSTSSPAESPAAREAVVDGAPADGAAGARPADDIAAPTPELAFLVVDGEGEPVDRAEVELHELRGRKRGLQLWLGATDAIGRVAAPIQADELLVAARKPGVGWSGDVKVRRAAARGEPQRLVLLATARVRGTVLRIDERPAAGLLVRGRSSTFDAERVTTLPPCTTNAEGVFECEVLAGRDYTFSATHDGRWTRGGEVPELAPGVVHEVTLQFPGAFAVGGVLRDSTGQPLAGKVWLMRREAKGPGQILGATSSDTGRFNIDLVAGGTFDLVGGVEGRTAAHVTVVLDEIRARQDGLELRTRPFESVTGRVVDESGSTLAGIFVGVGFATKRDAVGRLRSRVEGILARGETVADGTFEFEVPAGLSCQLVARPVPGNRELLVRGPVVTAPASDVVLTIRAADRSGFVVVGSAVDPDGRPVARGEVHRVEHEAGGGSSMDRVGRIVDGRFEVGPLATGQRVSFEFQTRAFAPVRVGPFETTVRRETLDVRFQPYGKVRCRVQRPDGTPAVKVFVSLGFEPYDPFGPAWQGETDARGVIEFQRVIPRSYRVHARAPTAAGGKGSGDVHVVSGKVAEVDVVLVR